MSQRTPDPIEGKDSQKPWKSEKVPNLEEDWNNEPGDANPTEAETDILEGIESMEQGPASFAPTIDPRPQESHDLVTLKHNMAVGTYKLSQKTELLTITSDSTPYERKVIKRQTRKIIDICEPDSCKSEWTYEIT